MKEIIKPKLNPGHEDAIQKGKLTEQEGVA